ncbi:GTPase Obg [Candidatus Tiddalikarchaeum anstoanum]|nr:GTPase Obg [Candidatus Tiddalikarchaeum anstoanum]
MVTVEEQIKAIEDELARTQYNKHTEHHVGSLYGKIAKLKDKIEKQQLNASKYTGPRFSIKKSGDATVALVGFPSVGKSTLINAVANTSSKVAAYDFTTLMPIPGMIEYKNARIQIIDLPGIIGDASKGRGRGREVLSVARNAELILLLVDPRKPEQLKIIKEELYNIGVRLDKKPPKVIIKRTLKGGINVLSDPQITTLSKELIESVLQNFGIANADVMIYEKMSIDEFIDALVGNRHYATSILVFNKADTISNEELLNLKKEYPYALFISAEKKEGLDKLKDAIFEATRIMRIYLKPQGKPVDMQKPIIMRRGDTVYDVCLKIHRGFVHSFRYAQVWGSSAKFKGQKIGLNHILLDGDVLTIVF